MEMCLELLQKNKDKQIIIYSAFDNIYYQLFEEMDKLGLKVERIENNLYSPYNSLLAPQTQSEDENILSQQGLYNINKNYLL